jgi:dTDP-4-dehydrorhamnose 3,5-epimerase
MRLDRLTPSQLVVTRTPLDGVLLIDPPVFPDERGFFLVTWNQQSYADAGILQTFVQDAHSGSHRGVLRGLHYQDMTAPLCKLVRCTAGRVFDVAVDLRVGSPTFGRWFATELSADNRRQMFVPVGFAHGYQALSDYAEVEYKQTGFYAPPAEGVLTWNDPAVGVDWPIAPPIVSDRDARGVLLDEHRRAPVFTYSRPDAGPLHREEQPSR